MLKWRNVLTERSGAAFWSRGSLLATAVVPGTGHRFVLADHRTVTRGDDGIEYDREYRVRDAATVTDAEIRERVEPRVVATFRTEGEALAWCRAQAD